MKTLIVIAFAAVALFACLPEPSEATTLTYDDCEVYYKYTILKLRLKGQLNQNKFCTATNNYLICLVHVHENTNTELTDEQKTALEDYYEALVAKYGIECEFDVGGVIEQVRRKRSAQ